MLKTCIHLFLLAFSAAVSGLLPGAKAFAAPDTQPEWKGWTHSLSAGHQLNGKIWSSQSGGFISPDKMADDLAAGVYVLLGEVHDNGDHHRLQAWVIEQLARRGRKPAIVMEMIDSGQDAALKAYMSAETADAAGLGAALGWDKSGWPAWQMYQPIAKAVFAAGLDLYSANAPRKTIRQIGRKGLGVLAADRVKGLKLETPLEEVLEADLRLQIVEAHCNLLPASAAGPMVNVQRFRDALFAARLVKAAKERGAVFIGGGGHVRADRAVPYYLRRHQPDAVIKTVIFAELNDEQVAAADYGPKGPDGKLAADYIWFTPRAERPDPCEGLKKHLNKKRETKAKKP